VQGGRVVADRGARVLRPSASLPVEGPAVWVCARGGWRARQPVGRFRRQPAFVALVLCLFLVVGVPVLVLAVALGVHADESWSPSGDGVTGAGVTGDGVTGAGAQPSEGVATQDGAAGDPAGLADALAAARQAVSAAGSEPDGLQLVGSGPDDPAGIQAPGAGGSTAAEPASEQQGSGGPSPVTPELVFPLPESPGRDRERDGTVSGDGTGDGTGDGSGGGTAGGEGDGTGGGGGGTPAQADKGADPGGLVIELGEPGSLAWRNPGPVGFPAELARRYPDADPSGTDPATLGGAVAAGMAGWGPVTISPTPTSRERLLQFDRRAWELHQAIASGRLPALGDDFYLIRVPLPGPADPGAYNAAVSSLSPSGRLPEVEGHAFVYTPPPRFGLLQPTLFDRTPRAAVDDAPGAPWPADQRYRLYINATPEAAPDVMSVVVQHVENPQSGVREASILAASRVANQRNTIMVDMTDHAAVRALVDDLGALPPGSLVDDVPEMADRFRPGMGYTVEREYNSVPFSLRSPRDGERGYNIASWPSHDPAQHPLPDFDRYRDLVDEVLRLRGINPQEPHSMTDLRALAPEERVRLAGGGAVAGYHQGGWRSPAAVGTGVAAGMGLVLGGGGAALGADGAGKVARDVTVATGAGAVAGYANGQVELAANARLAPLALTPANSTLAEGVTGSILPRAVGGTVAGGVTAPLATWAAMGIDEAVFGGDYSGTDYAAAGARAAPSGVVAGGAGAGAGALTVYLLGGAAAGAWVPVPVVGSLAGAAVGVGVYFLADWLWGDAIERAVRPAPGGSGRELRTAAK
jgi:hypothetical protein